MLSNLDFWSKRILAVAVSITIILLAASVFVFSTQQALAKTPEKPGFKPNVADYYWAEIQGENVYFFRNGSLVYIPLSSAIRSW